MKKSDKQQTINGCCQNQTLNQAIAAAKKLKNAYDRQPKAKKQQINKNIAIGAAAVGGWLLLKKLFKK